MGPVKWDVQLHFVNAPIEVWLKSVLQLELWFIITLWFIWYVAVERVNEWMQKKKKEVLKFLRNHSTTETFELLRLTEHFIQTPLQLFEKYSAR